MGGKMNPDTKRIIQKTKFKSIHLSFLTETNICIDLPSRLDFDLVGMLRQKKIMQKIHANETRKFLALPPPCRHTFQ